MDEELCNVLFLPHGGAISIAKAAPCLKERTEDCGPRFS